MIPAMTSALHVVSAGNGPKLLFIHGSATDHASWLMQLGSPLRDDFSLVAYDRRGCGASPSADRFWRIEDHADDATELLASTSGVAPLLIGSSFGAVVALDVARRFPQLVSGVVMIEPPMAASDEVPPIPPGFLAAFDQLVVEKSGPDAAEYFLRMVLGDAAYEKMPRMFQQRSKAQWQAIRADSEALGRYPPRFAELAHCQVPTLLLGGERSAAYFRPTLDMLEKQLPNVRRVEIAGVGHMLHAEAPRRMAELVRGFADEVMRLEHRMV
jgi:3-oxoadipate enol-lactonase